MAMTDGLIRYTRDTTLLIDTSSAKGMPRNVLLRTLESGRAALSPWSVWEILSHLDEGEFARQRGYLARLLAAPLLERDAHQRLRWRFRIDRRTDTDADLLRRLLANLHDSRTLAE